MLSLCARLRGVGHTVVRRYSVRAFATATAAASRGGIALSDSRRGRGDGAGTGGGMSGSASSGRGRGGGRGGPRWTRWNCSALAIAIRATTSGCRSRAMVTQSLL